MANRDFIPGPDAEFDQFVQNYNTQLVTQGTGLGITAPEVTAFTADTTGWNDQYEAHLAAQATAKAMAQQKDEAREALEAKIRPFTKRIQADPNTTDAIREDFRITVPKAGRTPVPPPEETPLVRLDFGTAGRMRVHFGTDPGNEGANALPAGAVGVIVQGHNGGLPATEAEWVWLANDSNSPYVHVFAAVTATTWAYRVAYMNRKGEQGPWSAPAVGTISS